MPSNEAGHDQTPWATFGQANQLYSPLQLANYIATLPPADSTARPTC